MKKFYAYHGPENTDDFDFPGGYGVGAKSKWRNVNVGDIVYVIQKLKDNISFQICGVYKVNGHYESDDASEDRHYRFRLSDISLLRNPIDIDEEKLSKKLPQTKSNYKWSNFKVHFCQQGGSFNQPLDPAVVRILDELLPSDSVTSQPIINQEEFEKEIELELLAAQALSKAKRDDKLKQANKKPTKIYVRRIDYRRDQNVVVAVLDRAGGYCENCKNVAPFNRASDGTGYLEVHHKHQLADGGDDTVENCVALCPNCHREAHFGIYKAEMFE